MKTCTKCNKLKPLGSFCKRSKSRDGLSYICKTCNNACSKGWVRDNPEKQKNRTSKWYEDNKEQRLSTSAKWYSSNKERKAATVSRWHTNNIEKRRQSWRKRRAMKLNLKENFTPKDEKFIRMLFSDLCFKCHSSKNLTVDHHYPLSKGHPLELDNAVLLCQSCNSTKHTKSPEDFYNETELQKLTHMHRWCF